MSPLTKVFVVLVTVLSVVLVALVVPFVANTENYRAKVQAEQSRREAAEASARSIQAEHAAAQDKINEQISNLNNQLQQLTTQRNEYQSKYADASASVQGERSSRAKAEADVSRLTAANKQLADITAAVQAELTQRRSDMLEQQTKMIALADRNNELESSVDTLNRQLRHLQEQLTNVQERSKQFEDAVAKLDPAVRSQVLGGAVQTASAEFESTTPLKGKITATQIVGNDKFVQINIGKNDGVQAGMKFLVHRGNQFLGTLVITTVDGRAAAGRMKLSQGEIASGDEVLSGGQ